MSLLWVMDHETGWRAFPLGPEPVSLATGSPETVTAAPLPGALAPLLVRAEPGAEPGWLLLCPPAGRVRVNGEPPVTGARLLADRDAVAIGDGRLVFFSEERLAETLSFPEPDAVTHCIRCKLPLEPGSAAVRCPAPGCGFWHHQSEEQPCWTYAEGCASCGHPTAFDAGYQWSPHEL